MCFRGREGERGGERDGDKKEESEGEVKREVPLSSVTCCMASERLTKIVTHTLKNNKIFERILFV